MLDSRQGDRFVNYDPLKYSKFYDCTVARREGIMNIIEDPHYAKQSEILLGYTQYYSVDVRNGAVKACGIIRNMRPCRSRPLLPGGSSSGGSYRPSGNRPVTTESLL